MSSWRWYGAALAAQFSGDPVNWLVDDLRVMLTTAEYVPTLGDASTGSVVGEVAGNGYTPGGMPVSAVSVMHDLASGEVRLAFESPSWGPGATIAGIRVAVLHKQTDSGPSSLVAYVVLDGDQSVTNGTFVLEVDPVAVLKLLT